MRPGSIGRQRQRGTHRKTKTRWEIFLELGREAQFITNEKIKSTGSEWVAKVSEKCRKSAKKFRNHLHSLFKKYKK